MVKRFFTLLTIAVSVSSCTGFKALYAPANKLTSPRASINNTTVTKSTTQTKIVEDEPVTISYIPPAPRNHVSVASKFSNLFTAEKKGTEANAVTEKKKTFTYLQYKYSTLLNAEPYDCIDDKLLEGVDEWYGTRYRMGGQSKSGIDCSAFTRAVYLSTYGVVLPRTAREQYKTSKIISSTLLQEGDLVFFNTRGGVSHVGIYLQNNKFAHASSSHGVMVSDMLDSYYLQRFIGAGRIEKPPVATR